MRILLVNKFHWPKGGSETYYFELGKLLKKFGHEVAYFSMYNEKNISTGDKEYFVKKFDGNSKNISKAMQTIYSKDNKKKMLEALDDFNPDIVHINLFQRHLTYSIIEAINERNIPIVFTAHDLQAVCPSSAMLCNGEICQKCLNSSKFNCLKNKCVKKSLLKSLLCSIEGNVYKNKKVYDKIDLILSPSDFVGNMIKKEGINTRIETLHNFVDIEKFNSNNNHDDNYAFFFGRLSIEKGIINLVKAFSMQPAGNLYIAGDGPEKENIIKFISDNNLKDRVKMLGFLNSNQIKEYISNCSFVVVPSIWYENCPYSILETLATGKAVIGSKIGGIPELIEQDINGYLYDYDDVDELSKLINKLFTNENLRKKMGVESRKLAEKNYSIDAYYKKLNNYYEELVGEKKVSKNNE